MKHYSPCFYGYLHYDLRVLPLALHAFFVYCNMEAKKMKKAITSGVITAILIVAITLLRKCGYDVPLLEDMDGITHLDTISSDTSTIDMAHTIEIDPIPAPHQIRDTVIHYRTKIVNTTDTILKQEYVNRLIHVGAGEIKRLNAIIDSLKQNGEPAPVVTVVESVNEYEGSQTLDGATVFYNHIVTGELIKSKYRLEFPQKTITNTRERSTFPISAYAYTMNPTNEIAPAGGVGLTYRRFMVQYDYTHAWKMHRFGVGYKIF